jgi:hypothetical protein
MRVQELMDLLVDKPMDADVRMLFDGQWDDVEEVVIDSEEVDGDPIVYVSNRRDA